MKKYIEPAVKLLDINEESAMLANSDPATITGTVSNDEITSGYADAKEATPTSTSVWDE